MRTPGVICLIVVAIIAMMGCADTGSLQVPAPAAGDEVPIPISTGELMAEGQVIQRSGEEPQLCLSGGPEPLPLPPCTGPLIRGWHWADVDNESSLADSEFGTYAVFATWDGAALTVTRDAIPPFLDDSGDEPDPRMHASNAGSTSETDLLRIQGEVDEALRSSFVVSWISNAYLWVKVIYDDGSLQAYLDHVYGPDVVVVMSALRAVK